LDCGFAFKGAAVHLTFRQKLVAAVCGVAVLAGGGIAYSATQASSSRQAYLDDVAKRLNVPPSQLNAALSRAFSDRLAAVVAAGKITQAQAQANAFEQRVLRNGGVPFFGGGWHGPPAAHHPMV
jgi:enoyl-CoA hydratase/carnithine racemase